MTLTHSGETRTYGPGQRVDVPAGSFHSARISPRGCRYLVGER
jgi:hypothetical protein